MAAIAASSTYKILNAKQSFQSRAGSGPVLSPVRHKRRPKVCTLQISNERRAIRKAAVNEDTPETHDDLLKALRQDPKQVPSRYHYDERGSALWAKVIKCKEYYPFRTESDMLKRYATQIITHIPKGSVIVELGCGGAEKTSTLLNALLQRDGPAACTYLGIDISAEFLDLAKQNLLKACSGLREDRVELVQAEYMDGVQKARNRYPGSVLCFIWLGLGVGNLEPEDILPFFKKLLVVSGPNTEVLLCADLWKDSTILHAAYGAPQEASMLNAVRNAVEIASEGKLQINESKWKYDVVINDEKQQVDMCVIAGEDLHVAPGIVFTKGERVLVGISKKFSLAELRALAVESGFHFQAQWLANPGYSIQMLCGLDMDTSLALDSEGGGLVMPTEVVAGVAMPA